MRKKYRRHTNTSTTIWINIAIRELVTGTLEAGYQTGHFFFVTSSTDRIKYGVSMGLV